ncbi:gamma-glutamyltransferase [Alsobacter sp. SYSU M60028]|uniref:Gamma-glutamyltransferase n=1 Tax=Alsobacter ponti TaxID=2962936 RepID=A0ABT1LE05_9HYPH|nr:gamma-glutamyltransferase [Alsobacter ponti]MCP8939736.1 gamma-glutamyltransferase [Alsobacter ponti]
MTDTPIFASAAVAAPHSLASEAGRAVLAAGGNAVEAMVAMAAAIAVVYPHMNAVGGDGFWLVREPGGRLHGIDASGPAGALATIRRYRDKGYDAIPPRGPDAALTVAGAVGGWALALELARALGGRMPLRDLLGAAIGHARDGSPVSASQARTTPMAFDEARQAPGFSETFLVEGALPKEGATQRNAALAATLDHLASAGLDDFYRGDVGREIAFDLDRLGAPVTRADLEAYRARLAAPLTASIPGASLHNMPPPTQGLASLMILGVFARLGVERGESFAHVHGLVEATKRAFRVRDAVVTDPARLPADPASFLTAERLQREADAVSMTRAARFPLAWGEGDTVWMGAIDVRGTAVSYIQSIYWEYGSGCVLPRTGVLWQNRGASFSLDPSAPNPLEPGRKPFHTLNPAMAVFADGRVMPYGSMGGDGQPQFQAAIFTRHAFGMGPAEAVDAPRWLLGRTWGSASATLKLEDRFDPSLVRALREAGHEVEVLPQAYSDTLGHAGMLVRDPRTGAVAAAHDPRSDGGAAGL